MGFYKAKNGLLFNVSVFLFLFSSSLFSHANEVTVSFANNPNAFINNDTQVYSAGISSTLDENIQVKMNHQLQKKEAEKSEFSEINLNGGSLDGFSYKLLYGFGQPSLFFSSSSLGVHMMQRVVNTNISGFYQYEQDSYAFGKYRRAELGSNYIWEGTGLELGVRVENIDRSIALQYFVLASRKLKYVVGKVQAKILVGPQYIVDEVKVNVPEFGLRLKLKGQWQFLGMPSNTRLSYGINGMLIKRTAEVYRRFGGQVGIVYLY